MKKILVTGATGLSGNLFLNHLKNSGWDGNIYCLVRATSDINALDSLNFNLNYLTGDSSLPKTWNEVLNQKLPDTIIHIASIRHTPVILESLQRVRQNPRLIVIGTTGVYSKFNEYSELYTKIEDQVAQYSGSYCLLRPTMIYGSDRDKNLHKLIKFCNTYGAFPVFGPGTCLLQPIHADDLAKAILAAFNRPDVKGDYDLSGGSVVTFQELLALVGKLIDKPVRPIYLPLNLGLWLGTTLEATLGRRSPLRREQILRLQEDKAYPHDAAQRDLNFFPRTLEVGLQQEVELLRSKRII